RTVRHSLPTRRSADLRYFMIVYDRKRGPERPKRRGKMDNLTRRMKNYEDGFQAMTEGERAAMREAVREAWRSNRDDIMEKIVERSEEHTSELQSRLEL